VEADQVGAQEPLQQPLAEGKRAEYLRCRKRDVQEEGDARVRQALPHQLGHEHELVVVHPHEIPRLVVSGDDVGETLVDAFVGVPVLDVERYLVR